MFYAYSIEVGLFETIQKWVKGLHLLFYISHYI